MIKDRIEGFYTKHYKILLFIPIIFLIISMGIVGAKFIKTGELFEKDVSLKGGITATVYTDRQISVDELKNAIGVDSEVKVLSDFITGRQIGFVISVSDIKTDDLQKTIEVFLDIILTQKNYSVEETGPKLGSAFYNQLMMAVLFAFLLMGIAVFVSFRTPIPSLAVIFSAFTDIMIPLAIINLFGIKISTAGIVAFLLVIGYSVDTDILLTTWALKKRHEGRLFDRMYHSMKTGLTMTACALAVMAVGIIFTQSFVIKEMFIIILLALITDIFSTYFTNAGILSWYCEKKGIQ